MEIFGANLLRWMEDLEIRHCWQGVTHTIYRIEEVYMTRVYKEYKVLFRKV